MRQNFCNGIIHVIKEGENLYQLSRMYRVPLALIMRANPYVDVYNLQPGMEICIPAVRRPGGMMPPFGMRPPRPPMPDDDRPPRPPMPDNDRPPRPPMPDNDRPPRPDDDRTSRPPMPNPDFPNGRPGENGLGNNNQGGQRPQGPDNGPQRPWMPGDGARMMEQSDESVQKKPDELSANSTESMESEECETCSFVTKAVRPLSELLEEGEISMQEFFEYNSPEHLVIAPDVTYYLPKKK